MNKKDITAIVWNIALGVVMAFIIFVLVGPKVLYEYQGWRTETSAIKRDIGRYPLVEGALALVSALGALVPLFSFFQGRLNIGKRMVLALLCLSPLAAVIAAFSIREEFYRGLLLASCWQYPIPMWLLSAPGIFAGRGVLTFISGLFRRKQN